MKSQLLVKKRPEVQPQPRDEFVSKTHVLMSPVWDGMWNIVGWRMGQFSTKKVRSEDAARDLHRQWRLSKVVGGRR
jgi:hypothetical protein